MPEQEAEPEAPLARGTPARAAEESETPEQEPGPAAEGEETSEEGGSDQQEEDVLADTPDFLKDAPEDDELWFEQGKPKDFDF